MDRRPLSSRDLRVMQVLASALARRRVTPNTISVVGLVAGIGAGAALAGTLWADAMLAQRGLFLLAAGLIQLRLLCNMIDGMVAIEGRMRSPVGELYNEIPDRISDAATLIGAGYALGGTPVLGYLAAIIAVLTAYIRAVGKGAGTGNDFGGPMAKPHRMATMTVTCVLCAIVPVAWQPAWRTSIFSGSGAAIEFGLVSLALAIIGLGAALTCVLRLQRIAAKMRASAATERSEGRA